MTLHLLNDLDVLTQRARNFLAEHGRRVPPVRPGPGPESFPCTDLDGTEVDGPDDGLDRLHRFVAQYGGLSFCQERPACAGKHRQTYSFDSAVQSGWTRTESGGWVAEVGEIEGWAVVLDWATGRIGLDIHHPETWIAHSLVNLVESAALGQSLSAGGVWRKAVMAGHGPGWGLAVDAAEHLQDPLPEVTEASSPWNSWRMDQDIAVHSWQATYEPTRAIAAMAWYRTPAGRRRIETVTGPLATA